jgi:hypothetical protein
MEICKFVPHVLRHFEFEWASDQAEWEAKAQWFWRQTGMIARVYPRRRGAGAGFGASAGRVDGHGS